MEEFVTEWYDEICWTLVEERMIYGMKDSN